MSQKRVKAIGVETFVFLAIFLGVFTYLGKVMGTGTLFKVIMYTAHDLLLNTVFFIMAVAVLAGAFSSILSEFGVIALLNKLFSGLMKPLYSLPGASIIGVISTYLSDNPAIISLAHDKSFRKYFKPYQIPALCNLGTSYGMGLIVTTFMMGQGAEYIKPALIGNLGAIIGSVLSVRLMLFFCKKEIKEGDIEIEGGDAEDLNTRVIREGSTAQRLLDSMLEGGKAGVEMGLAIIPGVIIICTFVMIITFGPSIDPKTGAEVYKGVAYEGVRLLPKLGQSIMFILNPLFGFKSPEAIAFPITSLGAVGSAISLVPKFIADGKIGPNDIAVFTAMGMCWSGYLSTHVGMMDALGVRKMTSKAIISHTFGGLLAGISAHYIFMLIG